MSEKIKLNEGGIKKHSVLQSIVYHLFPGIIIFAFYILMVKPVRAVGFPSLAALILAGVFVIIPLELGIVWYNKRKQQVNSFKDITLYSKKLTAKQYIVIVLVVMIIMGLIFTLLTPFSTFIEENIFGFFPEAYKLDWGLDGEYSKSVMIITYTVGFFVLAVLAPTVEEIYYRGFLLPRVPELKGFDLLFHSFLFALYHFWTPWMIITRTIGVYPLIYAVDKKKNIYIGIISHSLVNTIDFIVGFIFIFQMTQ